MKKTLQNLTKAFIGESQARNRYTIYAREAQKEGYEQIAEIFYLTAEQEREHAKWLLRLIGDIKGDGNDEILTEVVCNNIVSDTAANLKNAILGEAYETETMYPEFADIAEDEGYLEIANRLRNIAKAELNHKQRFENFLKQVETKSVFKKEDIVTWQCRKCGYAMSSNEAPKECLSCGHSQAYFEVK